MVRARHPDKAHGRHHLHSRRMEDIQKAALAGEEVEIPASRTNTLSSHEKRSPFLMITCFLGIFISYFVYGLLQEKITKESYGDEKFQYFMFLVGIQCVINAMFAKTVSVVRGIDISLGPHRLFSVLAFTYVGAMVASNSSLSFISYPTQVLGKCAKPIPVLLLGVILGRRSYPLIKYLIVLLIVVGVALFLYKDKGGRSEAEGQIKLFDILGIGELLLIVSLTFDGLTGVIQDRLRHKHSVKAHHMMYAVNVYSAVYLGVAMFLSGEAVEAIGFIQRHPHVLMWVLVFGVASAIGQNFIFITVTTFGPLTCSIFTTTRKFFTILGSVIIFSHPLFGRQWVGVVLVFLGLGLDTVYGKAVKKSHTHHDSHHQSNPHHDTHADAEHTNEQSRHTASIV